MLLPTFLALAALAEAVPQFGGAGGLTMLRFGCPQVVIDRLDPLVNPGQVPSPHVHQIVGGNAFNASMAKTDVSAQASCTTCQFADNFSNYWTANVYFKARNGTFKRVPQGGAAYVSRAFYFQVPRRVIKFALEVRGEIKTLDLALEELYLIPTYLYKY